MNRNPFQSIRLDTPAPHWIYDRIHSGTIEVKLDPRRHIYLFPDRPETVTIFQQLRTGQVPQLRFPSTVTVTGACRGETLGKGSGGDESSKPPQRERRSEAHAAGTMAAAQLSSRTVVLTRVAASSRRSAETKARSAKGANETSALSPGGKVRCVPKEAQEGSGWNTSKSHN